MTYEQPTINTSTSARLLVQDATSKTDGFCLDSPQGSSSSSGAYQADE